MTQFPLIYVDVWAPTFWHSLVVQNVMYKKDPESCDLVILNYITVWVNNA